jgi:hypothetical protein
MPSAGREIAKFLSGIAFNETLGHWWLGVWGRDLLPWDFGFSTFTDKMNHVCMAVWPLLLIGLVWVGWLKKPGA